MTEADHHHHHHHGTDERWLAAVLPFVRDHLPPAPARVLEIGCGPLGGFVPALRTAGYDVSGIDPEAPEGEDFHQVEFEQFDLPEPVDAIVACTSLHHVDDLDDVLDRVDQALVPGGRLVVVEWASERFDEATAAWCFARLAEDNADPGWLQRHRDDWIAAGQPWSSYWRTWVGEERLHAGQQIVAALQARFDDQVLTRGPYFFADLDGIAEAEEQAAVDAGQIQPNGIRYVGRSTA